MKMSFPMKLLKNHDKSDETRSEYYDHEAIRLRGQKTIAFLVLSNFSQGLCHVFSLAKSGLT